MSKHFWIAGSAIAAAMLVVGCAKKQPPVVEAPSSSSVYVEISSSSEYVAPSSSVEVIDQAAIKRQRLQGLLDELMNNDVYFDYDDASLTSEGKSLLQRAATILKTEKAFNVVLEGHTDERGTEDYNLALGNRRAQTVLSYLKSLGVSSSDLDAVSKGEQEPKVEGADESSWAQNRRVHFSVQFK